jgi:ABC-type sugar transport system substrate-binding protein
MLGDSNAVAAANQAAEAGVEVGVSGIGGDDVGIQALRNSDPATFVGTSLFLPENYGKDLIPLACRLLAGEQIPAEVFVQHVFLDKDNLDEYYPAE